MLALKFSSSLGACSSRSTYLRTQPATRAFRASACAQLQPLSLSKPFANVDAAKPSSSSSILAAARQSHHQSYGSFRLPGMGRKAVVSSVLVGSSLAFFQASSLNDAIECESPPRVSSTPDPKALPPPPRSSINAYELSFGTVCGICAGVFIKKGVKAVAFVLGGVFVMLQYFTSLRLTRIDWSSAESRFQRAFHTTERDATGREVGRAPTVYSLWRWMVDFLTADFPPRATFIAGMILGLRLG